jgi:DNA-binding transcriptional regulator YiaG
MGKKYRSDALAAVHETALGLTEAGVMDKHRLREWRMPPSG